jgi:hypothetical protein
MTYLRKLFALVEIREEKRKWAFASPDRQARLLPLYGSGRCPELDAVTRIQNSQLSNHSGGPSLSPYSWCIRRRRNRRKNRSYRLTWHGQRQKDYYDQYVLLKREARP